MSKFILQGIQRQYRGSLFNTILKKDSINPLFEG